MSAKHDNLSPQGFTFEAIGTQWFITLYTPLSKPTLAKLKAVIHSRIEAFDVAYSRFRDDSLVSTMAKTAGTYTLPDDAEPLLNIYRDFYDITGGKFTPLIGQVLADAGYDASYSFQPKELTAPPSWGVVLRYEYPTVTLTQPALLDFGAAGKGYLVDIIVNIIRTYAVSDFCVNGGGDMYYHLETMPTAQVGLEHPDHDDEVIGIAFLKNQGICGSAGNRRRWATYHHTIDPHTLKSPNDIQAVWVIAETTMLADALTTALCFVSIATLQKHYTFEYAIMHDNQIFSSPSFPGKFF